MLKKKRGHTAMEGGQFRFCSTVLRLETLRTGKIVGTVRLV